MKDYLVKATAFEGNIRAYSAVTTNTIEEARRRQDSWATTTAALGRTMTTTVLMGAMLKGKDTITVKIEGGGPIGAIVADSNAKGDVRGYVSNSHVDFELNESGKLDVRKAVGTNGFLSVVKDLGLREHFTGQVPIVSGEISEDFTYYFATSEQIPSAVGAGVLVNPDLSVLAAGGFIIQVMPGATDEVITKLEERIASFPPISKLIEEGHNPEQILFKLLGEENVKVLEELPVQFKCKCSKKRLEKAIISLGKDEITAMIEEDGGAEASCHFCNEVYNFSKEELEELLQR